MRIHKESDMGFTTAMTNSHLIRGMGALNRVLVMSAALGLLTVATVMAESATDAEHLSWDDGLSQTTVFSIHEDQQGSVWFATEDGLNRFDGQTFSIYRNHPAISNSLPANLVRGVDAAPDGRIWVATEGGGVAVWDPATNGFTRYSSDSLVATAGLSSDYNRAILADRLGSVWIATRATGLDRLDPASGEATNYRHHAKMPSSLSDDKVYALLESRDGSLYAGTNRGLDRYDAQTNSFEHIHLGISAKKTRVRALYEDSSGVLWIGTSGFGLFSFDPLTGEVDHFVHQLDNETSLGDDYVQTILEDNYGQLWIGTSNGLDLLDRDAGQFERYTDVDIHGTGGSGSVTSLYLDEAGSLWVGTELGGLIRWQGERAIFDDTGQATAHIVTSFSENDKGELLYGTVGEGLVQVSKRGKVSHFKPESGGGTGSISDDRVMSLYRDSRGRVWVGTMRGGLNEFYPKSRTFRTFRHDPLDSTSLSADGVMTVHEDAFGLLWVGTFGGGLNAFDPGSGKFVAFRHDPNDPASLSNDRVTALLSTKAGPLWIGTDGGGLNLFDPETGTARRFQHDPDNPSSLPVDTICALFVDSLGTLWVGTRGGGLARMVAGPTDSADPEFLTYTEADGLPNSVIYAIQPDGAGRLWLSTNHGLSLFDPDTLAFTNYDVTDGLQANEFNFGASYRSSTGTLYFGGINGYNAFLPNAPIKTEFGAIQLADSF